MAIGADSFPNIPVIAGVKMASIEAGVRYANRKDVVLFALAEGSTVAGVFTNNAFCAAPVHIAKDHLAKGDGRVWLINTGNANAGTGKQGFLDAMACCQAYADELGIAVESVLPFSTGVIGEPLPVNAIVDAKQNAVASLVENDWQEVGKGIMTTDTRPKGAFRQIQLQGKTVTIGGVSKGAGMICPNMATMLGFVATDAGVSKPDLQALISASANASFNRITIDGDTSTNDALVIGATGASGVQLAPGSEDWVEFAEAVEEVTTELATAIVRDGEGVTKFVTIEVEQGASDEECQQVARTVAHSPLVKTALFASDPNWGRILAAVGRSGLANLDVEQINIWLGDVCIVENGGRAASYTEDAGQAVMDQEEIIIRVALGRGEAKSWVWTTDFSHEYVTINAEYRT